MTNRKKGNIYIDYLMRGGAVWKLVGLITQRSLVQIQAPLLNIIKGLEEILSPFLLSIKFFSNPISNLFDKNQGKKHWMIRRVRKNLNSRPFFWIENEDGDQFGLGCEVHGRDALNKGT